MKKVISVVLSALLLTSITGCTAKPNNSTNESSKFVAGEYETTAKGHNDNIVVKTVFSTDKIEEITIVSHGESKGISDLPIENIPKEIIQNQSLAIDVVSGATVTSTAILSAVEQAVVAAKGDVESMKKPIEKGELESIEKETDVVVIGSGIAGVTAALQAQQNGANVILVEKMSKTGGSTALSGGMIVATNSFLQEGIEDSAEELAEYWFERSEGKANEEMLSFAAEESKNTIQWLADNGVEFNTTVGTSGLSPKERAITALDKGPGLIDPIVEKFLANGGELMLETKATELILNENNDVIGVKAESKNGSVTIQSGAVVMATGGFDANPEMVAEYSPRATGNILFSNVGNTGDGIKMGMEAGADTVFTGSVIGFRGVDSTVAYYSPIGRLGLSNNLVVDQSGSRFYNESLDYSLIYNLWDENGSEYFYSIFDSSVENPALEEAVNAGYAVKADSLEDISKAINAENLIETVTRYNELATSGVDSDFNKDAKFLTSIENGPYYAVTIKSATLGSFGGLKINMDAQVLNTEGQPINGLYASGEVANGEWFNQFYPASGSSISISATFGRVAGENAAKSATK